MYKKRSFWTTFWTRLQAAFSHDFSNADDCNGQKTYNQYYIKLQEVDIYSNLSNQNSNKEPFYNGNIILDFVKGIFRVIDMEGRYYPAIYFV